MAEKIKVILKRVFVKNDADWFGSGEFYFIATIDGKSVGDRKHIFDAREGQWINLPPDTWSVVVDVTGNNRVVVKFNGKDDIIQARAVRQSPLLPPCDEPRHQDCIA